MKDKNKNRLSSVFEFIIYNIKYLFKFFLNKKFRSEQKTRYKNGNGYDLISRIKHREVKKCFGKKNPDKTFYVIRRFSMVEGQYSMISSILAHLHYIDGKGYIPIVDMKNYYNKLWQQDDKKYKENAWDYLYENLTDVSLSDVYQSKNVILSWGGKCPPKGFNELSEKNLEIVDWKYYYDKYIIPNSEMQRIIDESILNFEQYYSEMLGVCIRRDHEYICRLGFNLESAATKVSISFDQRIEQIADILENSKLKYIFLCIDDEEGLQLFKNRFGNKLLYINRVRSKMFENNIPIPREERLKFFDLTINNEDTFLQKEAKYTSEVMILSKCNSLIANKCTTYKFAYILNEKRYYHLYHYDGSDNLVKNW